LNNILVLGASRSGVSVVTQSLAAVIAEGVFSDVSNALGSIVPSSESETNRLGAAATVFHAPDRSISCSNLRDARLFLQARPGARALVVWRQGVAFVNSRLRACREMDFVSHCLIWSRAIRLMRELSEAFPGRILPIQHERLCADPADVAGDICRFFSDLDIKKDRLAKRFRSFGEGRTSTMLDGAVRDPAHAGWSMAEVEIFHSLCGAATRELGSFFDLATAERKRPIDIVQALLDRGQGRGGAIVEDSAERAGPPTLSRESTEGRDGSAFRLLAVAAGQRRRFRLRISVLEGAGQGEFRCEIVECLTRRPIFVRALPLTAGAQLVAEADLPKHDGLLEVSFVQTPASGGGRFKVALESARLSME
jgi:hypothetical protein